MRRLPTDTQPEFRNLRIYTIDPMIARAGEYQATVQIRFEKLSQKGAAQDKDAIGFFGRRLEVIDVDASGPRPAWLKPVNLDDANIAMQHGLEPSESDPQFHQQMVYAVAMRTLEQFDRALGRFVYFRGRRRLRLVPHAFRGSNAFYHPNLRAVLFGHFPASEDAPGENLPGQTIFTCLSHDIIAHEVTHAIVDRLRPHFNVATNPHVRAFHEGFADLVAVFQRLSSRDLVQRALSESRGDPSKTRLLSDIAAQFGEGLGNGGALRSALDKKTTKIQGVSEEHALGAVLVAAIFEGFQLTYEQRTSDLIRIASGGTGVLPTGALHPDLITRLTMECVRTAQSVLTMCIRAFDYLPPADVTFGAFLRALVTADWELNPLDEVGMRAAIIEACRRRGIFAAEAGSLAVSALLLDSPPGEEWTTHRPTFQAWVDLAIAMRIDEERAFTPEDALEEATSFSRTVQSQPDPSTPQDEELEPVKQLRSAIENWFGTLTPDERARLGMRANSVLSSVHFHSSVRVTSDGTQRFGLVVQVVEVKKVEISGIQTDFPSGATIVIDVSGEVRFVIAATPPESRKSAMQAMARLALVDPQGWPVEAGSVEPFAVDYRGLHEART